MLSNETIKMALQDRVLSNVCDRADVSYPTIRKMADGKFDNINHLSVQKVSDYLESTGVVEQIAR